MSVSAEALSLGDEVGSPSYRFSAEFQDKIAALSIRDNSFRRRTEGLIRPDYFENMKSAILVAIVDDYWAKYREVPGSVSVWTELLSEEIKSERRVRKDIQAEIIGELKRLLKCPLTGRSYVADKVGEFARHQAMQQAFVRSLELMDKGDYESVQKVMTKAFNVGVQDDFDEVDFWEDVDRRCEVRKEALSGDAKPKGIPTGIAKFDNLLLHKGWGRKELSVLMGGAKRGKSMGLGEFAVRASLLGYNTLYVTLEVANSIIADRMDANVSVTAMNDLTDKVHEVRDKVKAKLDTGKRVGKLKIVEYPSGSLSPSGLRRVIERYRADGILFDLIVVDYADIMRPDYMTNDPIENSKQVWLGLRAIGSEENAAMLTATQTNREGFKESTAKAEHAAEDFNKIRIADLVVSINRDDEERERGEARLYFAASRNQEGEFAVTIKQDLATMRFITGIVSVHR